MPSTKGTVKFFNSERGFGQIVADGASGSVLFDDDQLGGFSDISTGDRVEFDVEVQARGRPRATNVRRLASADVAGHRGKCFVVMPSGRNAEELRWFSGWYKMVIEEGVRAARFEPILAATQDQPNAINDEIRAHLAFDPMVVVDLGGFTAEAEPNPNVMYELGLRHALNLPVVLMAWANQHLPFDISNQRVIMERRDLLDIPTNRDRLTRFIQEAVAGNFYRPMDAVGRVATLERAESVLNQSTVLAALVREVRDLKSRVGPQQRFTASSKVKQALGSKGVRKALLERFLEAGGTGYQWTKVLQMDAEKAGFSNDDDKLPDLLRLAATVPSEPPPSPSPSIAARAAEVRTANLPQQPMSEEFVAEVRRLMPTQPWPKGAAALVADELQSSRAQVAKAVQELIRRGVFLDQQDGVLISGPEREPPREAGESAGTEKPAG